MLPRERKYLPGELLITQLSRLFVALCVGVMVGVIWLSVFTRYALSSPLPWPEQLAKYLMIWMAFVGGSLGVRNRAHVAVDLLVSALPERAGKVLEAIAVALSGLFLLLATGYGISFAWRARDFSDPVMNGMTLAIPYAAIPVGCALMFLQLIFVTRRGIEPSGDTASIM